MSNEKSLRASARSSLIWLGGASLINDGMNFAATIVLTRLLSPAIYGQSSLGQNIIGLVAVISFRSFVNFALQSRDPEGFDWKAHLRAGYRFNLVVFTLCNIISLSLWLSNGSKFYAVCEVVSVMSLSFLLEPLSLTRMAWLQAHHQWHRTRMIELCMGLTSSSCGVALALGGFGPIALGAMAPIQQLPALLDLLFFGRRLNPPGRSQLTYEGATRFTANRLGSALVQTSVALIEQFLLSSLFGFSALGLYNRAIGLVTMTSARIGPLVMQSIYPVLTRADAGSARFRNFSQILVQSILFVVVPATIFFSVDAANVVHLLFGKKWDQVVAYIPLAAIYVNLGSLNLVVYQIMLANLQHNTCLKIDMGAAGARIIVAVLTIPHGVVPFLIGLSLLAAAVLAAEVEMARRTGGLAGWDSFRAALPIGVSAAAAAFSIYVLPTLPQQSAVEQIGVLAIHGTLYSAIYLGMFRLAAPATLHAILRNAPLPAGIMGQISRLLLLGRFG